MGEFQGLLVGTMWPLLSCSSTRDLRLRGFSMDNDHCSTQTGVSESQLMRGWSRSAVAHPKNLGLLEQQLEFPTGTRYPYPTV